MGGEAAELESNRLGEGGCMLGGLAIVANRCEYANAPTMADATNVVAMHPNQAYEPQLQLFE